MGLNYLSIPKLHWCSSWRFGMAKWINNFTQRYTWHVITYPCWWHRPWWFIVSPWASYQIRKIASCACAGNAGDVFPRRRFQRKPLVSDPGMHHGTCVTHVPWCMSGSLTCSDGENVPGISGACAPPILCIWQEAHCKDSGDFSWNICLIEMSTFCR